MSLYLSVGHDLLAPDAVVERALTGELEVLRAGAQSLDLYGLPTAGRTAFTPVGLGRPLAVELRALYTGALPAAWWWSERQDLLVTTAHKPITQQAAAARALNLLQPDVGPHTLLRGGSATQLGTPIVYYTPALVEPSLTLTVELGFENFSRQLLDTLSRALHASAAVPIFATKSMYLLAGGLVTRLMADLGKALFEKGPEFVATDTINFARAGLADTAAGYGVLFAADVPPDVPAAHRVSDDGTLVRRADGAPYQERWPWAVVSLDGAARPEYERFQPAAAAAELLARFYNVGENRSEAVDVLLEGLQYVNDMKYRREAAALDAEAAAAADPAARERLVARRTALVANIGTAELRP